MSPTNLHQLPDLASPRAGTPSFDGGVSACRGDKSASFSHNARKEADDESAVRVPVDVTLSQQVARSVRGEVSTM
ncbi:hypothetical protein PG993_014787 [Apiospora rasikravindrae]|uniref:Uncharacterized protein n=1 Tax=Apiospora rasikravindrae TaxID=990691 RepID=A0ABR1RNU8_9PEZI